MAKIELPKMTLELDLVAGSADKASKLADAGKATMQMVPVDQIYEIPDFNVRVQTDDYEEHVNNLALSIIANGYYQDKPLSVYAGKVDGADKFMLTDGYSRLRAVRKAIERGAEIVKVPAVVKPQTQTIEDLTVALLQSNEGRALTVWEKAVVVKRLSGYGMEDADIAKRLGFTDRYVSDLLLLSGAPKDVRDMVIKGKIVATLAITQLRKNPAKATEALKGAVETAAAAGKAKATAKHVDAPKEPKADPKAPAAAKAEPRIYSMKAGDVAPRNGQVKEILLIAGATGDNSWWEYVDAENKDKGIRVTRDIRITVTVEDSTAADETTADKTDDDEMFKVDDDAL